MTTTSETKSLEKKLNRFFSDYETYLESERKMKVKEFISLARKEAIKECIEAIPESAARMDLLKESLTKKFLEKENICEK